MARLYIYRVYRTKAVCVWSGPIKVNGEPIPNVVTHLLRNHVVAPKHLAKHLSTLFLPLGDNASKIIAAYPGSFHHAAVQEFGIGFALGKEKWTKFWPQFKWSLMYEIDFTGWRSNMVEWGVKDLASQRNSKRKRPCGLEVSVWDKLGALRK